MQKLALVTGGTGGIGNSICRNLTQEGYYVIINYAHAEKEAKTLAEEIGGYPLCFDVSDRNAVAAAIKKINDNFGEISLLVNNAGISEINLFTHVAEERANAILDVNLKGTLNCSRAVLPQMINRKHGCIINISSIWGQCGASCEVDYSASKAGIIGFTKALAKETGPSGIRVNCISPGFIMTKMNSSFTPEELEAIAEEIPLGVFGKPEHIADAVSFLASDKAEYITGQNIAVNGGMYI